MFKMFASEMLSLFWLRAWLCHLHLSPVHFQLFRKYVLPVNLKHFLNCGHRKGACRVFLGVDSFQNLVLFCSFLCNTGILHAATLLKNQMAVNSHHIFDDMAVDLYLNKAFTRSSFFSFLFVAGKRHEGDRRPAESQGI